MTWIGVHRIYITEEYIKPYVSEDGAKRKVASLRNEKMGKTYAIIRPKYVIGKSESADIRIEDNLYVGNMHALLYKEEDQYYLVDRGSPNGTYINGKKLKQDKRYLLEKSAKIEFADEVFGFEV